MSQVHPKKLELSNVSSSLIGPWKRPLSEHNNQQTLKDVEELLSRVRRAHAGERTKINKKRVRSADKNGWGTN
jgi:hypothetical protein